MIDEGLYGYTIVIAFVSHVFTIEPSFLVLDFLYDINRDVLNFSANSQLSAQRSDCVCTYICTVMYS